MGRTIKMLALSAVFFLPILSARWDSPKDSSCEAGWLDATWVDMGGLLFYSGAAMTWEKANDHCQKQEDAKLVEATTEDQFNFLIMELNLLDDHEKSRDWWTSGTDIGREGNWTWMGSLSQIEDFVWRNDQPNGGIGFNCLALQDSFEYLGDDYNCASALYPICQKSSNETYLEKNFILKVSFNETYQEH